MTLQPFWLGYLLGFVTLPTLAFLVAYAVSRRRRTRR
jgi:hypothetical protein